MENFILYDREELADNLTQGPCIRIMTPAFIIVQDEVYYTLDN